MTKGEIDVKEYCKYFFVIAITLLIIYIIRCLSKTREGMNTNSDKYVSYKLSSGRKVSKSDFEKGKWPWNNGNGNGNGNGGNGGNGGEDFVKNITSATNRWIDLVTNDNLIGGGMDNDKRNSLIGDLFCLKTPDGKECKSSEDNCASLFGTVSNKLRRGRTNIQNYFVYFANLPGLSARSINEPIFTIQKLSDDVYLNSALITWTWDDGPGSGDLDPLVARMSFTYKYNGNKGGMENIDNYCIIQLHSSAMPDRAEGIPDYLPLSDSTTQFWNGEKDM